MVMISRDGERTFIHYIGANATLTEKDVDWSVVKRGRILHVAGTFLMPGFDGQPTANVLKKAKVKVVDEVTAAVGVMAHRQPPVLAQDAVAVGVLRQFQHGERRAAPIEAGEPRPELSQHALDVGAGGGLEVVQVEVIHGQGIGPPECLGIAVDVGVPADLQGVDFQIAGLFPAQFIAQPVEQVEQQEMRAEQVLRVLAATRRETAAAVAAQL